MSILDQQDEVNVFPCPACGETISSLTSKCKYCRSTISEEMKQSSIEAAKQENRRIDMEFHRNVMMIGVVIMFVGAGLLGVSIVNMYAGRGSFFIWSPIITMVGIGQTVYGILGMRKAKYRE